MQPTRSSFLLRCLFFMLSGLMMSLPSNQTSIIKGEALGSENVVIAELYARSNTTGSTYNRDYAVLFNLSGVAISLQGWSIQYAGATGTSWSKVNLSGSILPYSYFLVRVNSSGTIGADLPLCDVCGAGSGGPGVFDMAGAGGKVALLSNQESPGAVSKPTTGLVDFVGYGTANSSETSSAPATTTSVEATIRKNFLIDTDNNSDDFFVGTAIARNSSSFAHTEEIFSSKFLLKTSNKENMCDAENLEWDSLEQEFNALSNDNKNSFRTNNTNSTIMNARERYLYLRSVTPDLPNFAGL
jgi:hypothetical protein